MDTSAVVSLDRVGVVYDNGVVALESVSLQLKRGEFAIVLGSSGAGKSTLLRTLNHLRLPTHGKVTVEGVGELTKPSALRLHRKRTGMIFQQHQLIERYSALKNVLMGRLAYHSFWKSLLPLPKLDQLIALDCLKRVGLIDKALTPVKSLSGGQQQRVGIARALAQKPRLMLADEPIASLDPTSAHQVLALLRDICKSEGIAALLSLHQLEFAKQYGDRIIGLANGRVIFDGSPSALHHQHLDEIYTKRSLEPVM
ncbi:phosphonate ABC transporter, ATP-binding protein [Rubidibacter lacunae KORDI 51-2]|uniref:Phosphonate ABC transporter, ATP-binding protein n=1 Tax=Rubidibacter lacunae KORDI 51-2 TaxID=582515 RepID=U5DMN0_9CHRO|nr:phosphonate ABC transporter ATP-binding protein [Rubidibacter lacunae]ERN41869.1 phosphonate ABC transporter, ATP-binding protein [Rubidibacter lacunae KORDI 51-2]